MKRTLLHRPRLLFELEQSVGLFANLDQSAGLFIEQDQSVELLS
jgi:hypothetical protein